MSEEEKQWYERMKIRDMSGARSEHVFFRPSGRGNIIWCWIINDAYWMEWSLDQDGHSSPTCGGCGWADHGYQERGESLSTAFMTQHTFICGIGKPTKSWMYSYIESFNKHVDIVEDEFHKDLDKGTCAWCGEHSIEGLDGHFDSEVPEHLRSVWGEFLDLNIELRIRSFGRPEICSKCLARLLRIRADTLEKEG